MGERTLTSTQIKPSAQERGSTAYRGVVTCNFGLLLNRLTSSLKWLDCLTSSKFLVENSHPTTADNVHNNLTK